MGESARSRRWTRWLPVGALIVGMSIGAWSCWVRYATYHFAEVDKGALYRDGNRSMREFAAACRRGQIRTVVMLNDDQEVQKEHFKGEIAFCQVNGIRLERIPMSPGQWPTTEDVRKFLAIATDPARRPVLVHCAQGVRRTGMMAAAYQQTVLGYDRQQAREAILPWGRAPERLADIVGFIDDYDPVTRSVGNAHVLVVPQDKD